MSERKIYKFHPDEYFKFLHEALNNEHNKMVAITLRNALIKHHAVIAGGSLTRVYSKCDPNIWHPSDSDLDIYVKQKDAVSFIESIRNCNIKLWRGHVAPAYCESFLRKNKILSRISGNIGQGGVPFDLMIVDNDRNIKDLVTNFDLTFCEIWYDGMGVFSSENLIKKQGILRSEYQDELFRHDNYFIKKRIQKYASRGFKIEVEKTSKSIYLEFNSNNIEKVVDNPEEWVVKLLIKEILKNSHHLAGSARNIRFSQIESLFVCGFKSFTLSDLNANIKKYIIPSIMKKYGLDIPISIKAIYIIMIHPIYKMLNKSYRAYIKSMLKISTADFLVLERLDTIEDFLKSDYSTQVVKSLSRINKQEYDTFITKNKKGFDFIENEEVALKLFLKIKGNIVLVTPDNTSLCVNMDYIKNIYFDKTENWMYECNGPLIPNTNDRSRRYIDLANPYIKMTISMTGLNGFIPATHIEYILRSKRKMFFIKPEYEIEDGRSIAKSISHSITYPLAKRERNATAVSTNHCQHGSNILIYNIYEYDARRFLFPEGSSRSMSNSDTQSSS